MNDFELELFTDSAGNVNLGTLWGNDWYSLRLFSLVFPVEHSEIFLYVIFFQLFPITMSFEVWVKTLSGKLVIIHTDNVALVSILNQKTVRTVIYFRGSKYLSKILSNDNKK